MPQCTPTQYNNKGREIKKRKRIMGPKHAQNIVGQVPSELEV
jgi:hypothetical protein